MQIVRTMIAESRAVAALAMRAAIVAGCALVICGCNTDQPQVAAVPDVPTDYRLRHPITISEADHSLEIFVGSNRGELSATQRAEVLAFAQTWKHEATGGVLVNLPVGTGNERAAAAAGHEVRSILAASGVPADGIVVRGYHPPGGRLATIHITYPKISAQAGPCGLWPQDIGPSLQPRATSKISRPGISVAPPNATSPLWWTTRPIWCSRAPKRRPIRCGAPRSWKNISRDLNRDSISDNRHGQGRYWRWPMILSS